MAIFKRQADTGEQAGQPAEASGSVAVDESVPETQPAPAVTPEAVIGSPQAPGNLPDALEPELRRIIDTAVARVAAIELEAIREARHLTQRSEHEARDALRFALDRGLNLISSLELLAATVNGMAEALKTELDDAIVALRNVSEPQSELAEQLMQRPPPPIEEEAHREPQAEEPAPEPQAEQQAPEPEAEEPAPEPEPVAEESAPEPQAQEPEAQEPEAQEPEPQPQEPAPQVRLTPLVRPREPAPDEPAAEEHAPEQQLVTSGAPAPRSQERRGRMRRFFTR